MSKRRIQLLLVAILIVWGVATFFAGGYVTLIVALILGALIAKG